MVEKCPYCREAVEEDDRMICPSCKTPHHPDCWHENEGCTIFGCENTPVEEPKVAVTGEEVAPMAANSTTAKYFLARGGEKSGPFSLEEVRERIRYGYCKGSDLCWKDGDPEWHPVSSVLGAECAEAAALVARSQSDKVDPLPGVWHFGRRLYWLCVVVLWLILTFFSADKSIVLLGVVIYLAGAITAAVYRTRDLGYSMWYLICWLIPVLNVWFGFHLLFSPRGYAITKKGDWVQKVGAGLIIGLFLLIIVALALPNLYHGAR